MNEYCEDGYPIRNTAYFLRKTEAAIFGGADVVDAINKNCPTIESYTAALKKYNLKPVIPD